MQNTLCSTSISLHHNDSESTDQVLLLVGGHMTHKIKYKLTFLENFFPLVFGFVS